MDLPSRAKLLHRGHELVDLLRGEHGGRLVEDEDLIVAVEHLEDLDALLHADGDVLDLGVEVDLQAVFSESSSTFLRASLRWMKPSFVVSRRG